MPGRSIQARITVAPATKTAAPVKTAGPGIPKVSQGADARQIQNEKFHQASKQAHPKIHSKYDAIELFELRLTEILESSGWTPHALYDPRNPPR
jgi:hypothetical protein